MMWSCAVGDVSWLTGGVAMRFMTRTEVEQSDVRDWVSCVSVEGDDLKSSVTHISIEVFPNTSSAGQ